LVASSFLIVGTLAGVELSQEIKVQGLSFTIEKPEVIKEALLILNLYFLWRFYQYAVGDDWWNVLKGQFGGQLNEAVSFLVQRDIKRNNPSLKSFSGKFGYWYLKKVSTTKYLVDVSPTETMDGEKLENGNFHVSRIKIQLFKLPLATLFILREKVISDYVLPFLYGALASYLYFV